MDQRTWCVNKAKRYLRIYGYMCLLSVDRKCQKGWTMVIMQRAVGVETEERSFISYFNNFKRCHGFIHDFIWFLKVFFKKSIEIECISFCDSQGPKQGHLPLPPTMNGTSFSLPQGPRQLLCPSFAASLRAGQLWPKSPTPFFQDILVAFPDNSRFLYSSWKLI